MPHPSLIGRLEALQQQAVSGHDIVDAICVPGAVPMDAAATWIRADALDPILAELRRLQVQDKTEDKATRVDVKCFSDRQDLSQPATGDKSPVRRLIEVTNQWGQIRGVFDVESLHPSDLELNRSRHNREFVHARDYDSLRSALAASEARQQELKAELVELNTLADTYATQHGGYVGNAKGVLLALLERDNLADLQTQLAEADAARQQAEQKLQEVLTAWEREVEHGHEVEAEVSDLRAQIARLLPFSRHGLRCSAFGGAHPQPWRDGDEATCDCGLSAARVTPPQKAAPK